MIDTFLLVAVIAVAVPLAVLTIECLAALAARDGDSVQRVVANSMAEAGLRPAVDLLIPAHNEAAGIGHVLDGFLSQIRPGDRVLVVADNCSDATAEIARGRGACVLERHDEQHRGKGYTLAAGIAALERGNFGTRNEIVIVLDADCQLATGAIDALALCVVRTGRPAQGAYLMHAPDLMDFASPRTLISELAVTVKNRVRLLGLARLGMPSLLTGSGMALPAAALASVTLASGEIVEDMKLGVDLLIAGHPPIFCDTARVLSPLPVDRSAADLQRTRWEHGHLQTSLTQIPRLVAAALRGARPSFFVVALDLCVPPLSLLVMLWTGMTATAIVAAALGASRLPAAIAVASGLLAGSSLALAIVRFRRPTIPLAALAAVPWYVLAKIPRFLAFATFRRQREWIRTPRDAKIAAADVAVEKMPEVERSTAGS